jgi:hypothetical protein
MNIITILGYSQNTKFADEISVPQSIDGVPAFQSLNGCSGLSQEKFINHLKVGHL